MANPNFMKVLPSGVEFLYPKLDATYRYNATIKQSEKCQPTANGAAWSISWIMSAEKGQALLNLLKKHYETCAANDKSLPAFGTVFGMKKRDDGTFEFSAKRRGTDSKGNTREAPKVVGADKQPLKDLGFWSGSTGNVIASAFPARDPDGKGGISLSLDAVQVVTARYGSDGLDDFKDESGHTEVSQTPSGDLDF